MDNCEYKRIFYFNITFSCNNKCRNCISHSTISHNIQVIDVNDLIAIDELYHIRSVDVVNINGGEPTLSYNFEEIINWIFDRTHHIVVYSNGRNISMLPGKIINAVERFIIPIYGNEDAHDKYVGVKGAYQETIESLAGLLNAGIVDKCEVKLLFDETGNIEDFMQCDDWSLLLNNHRFSITRVLDSINDCQPCSLMLSSKAEETIISLLRHGKCIKFYDYPICQFSKSFQDYLARIYDNEPTRYSEDVIYCGKKGKSILVNYRRRTKYWEKCKKCSKSIICTQIMHNYFCPTIEGEVCKLLTE